MSSDENNSMGGSNGYFGRSSNKEITNANEVPRHLPQNGHSRQKSDKSSKKATWVDPDEKKLQDLIKSHKKVAKEFKKLMSEQSKPTPSKDGSIKYKKFDKHYQLKGTDYHEVECRSEAKKTSKFFKTKKPVDFEEYENRDSIQRRIPERWAKSAKKSSKSIKKLTNRLYKDAFKRETKQLELSNKYLRDTCTFKPYTNEYLPTKSNVTKKLVFDNDKDISVIDNKSQAGIDQSIVNVLINLDNLDESGHFGLTDPEDLQKLEILKNTIRNAIN